ncbi:MAG: tetratricopeptide repeat protein [Pseudomonadota bacterium]
MHRILTFSLLLATAVSFAQTEDAGEATDVAAAMNAFAPATDDGTDPLAAGADRLEAGMLYRSFAETGDYPQALDAAARALALTEDEFGMTARELVPALNDMGEALLLNRRPAEAKEMYARSVALVEQNEGIFSPRLFTPYLGAGESDQMMGRHEEAVLNFQRAQYVTHRTEGVYNLTQIPAMSALVESMMAQQKWVEAENVQLAIYKIHRGRFGEGSMASLPAMYELAEWYQDIMDYRQARLIYRDTIEIIEREQGPNALALVTPLRGMASAWGEERNTDFDKGLRAHQRIAQIVDSSPDVDSRTRIVAHLELGDWYVQFNREEDAWHQYRVAWELAQEVEVDERVVWEDYFNRPHLIHPGATLSVDFMGYGRVGDEVYYDFEFDIARNGRPQEIDVLGTNLHGQTRSAAIQAFRYARFRPRIVDGATIATTDYKVRRIYPTPAPADYGVVGFSSSSGPREN